MPVQSELFRGDSKLEACPVQASAPVTQGAAGAHVGKIQVALRELDGPRVVDGEVSVQSYGSQVDNIVGKMTIATRTDSRFGATNITL